MAPKDERIDVYIAKSAPFARPILAHLRAVVHAACPEVEDLPSKRVLTAWIKRAMKLNDEGVKAPIRKSATPRKALPVPASLRAALARNKRAAVTFEAFAPSHCYEYVEWITEAKREETRAARLKQAIEWLAEGKVRNWKYRGK